ncbi:MAG: 50S ribosomal protein L24 [Conexivisphaerales archaeon]
MKNIVKKMNWSDRNKQMHSMVSDELKKKYGFTTARVRKGDMVKVMRGDFSGVQGKVTKIFAKQAKIGVEGLTRKKINGQEVPVKVHSSNVMITQFDTSDKNRFKGVNTSG